MSTVTIRDLRNRSADVLRRVDDGERLIVTRDGEPVASLGQVPRRPLSVEQLRERRRHLPRVDAAALQSDLDDVIDPAL
ncbi:type II toxin-antitoxin system prevent-host-death family antitoxin [Brachybacterium sp. Marseille-Q7125]|uniref:type II toxin-antitoxin system Phd/YefM family antitoxin n=1 Tax=Brachybacterium sp. Marseille-Q7125 TaxID=2932815 RepID=UPI001FF19E7A|nr:type II toxin-antitoxin system prevent-host-death family antitoxin [Brachybacterium sp. Marseille-Q7125]